MSATSFFPSINVNKEIFTSLNIFRHCWLMQMKGIHCSQKPIKSRIKMLYHKIPMLLSVCWRLEYETLFEFFRGHLFGGKIIHNPFYFHLYTHTRHSAHNQDKRRSNSKKKAKKRNEKKRKPLIRRNFVWR